MGMRDLPIAMINILSCIPQISAFVVKQESDVKQLAKIYFVKAVEVRIHQSFLLYSTQEYKYNILNMIINLVIK